MSSIDVKEIIKFLCVSVPKCRMLVVGDVMLDQYYYGLVSRISPEAPVPVNLVSKIENALGGAANVAHNLSRLGCQVMLAGVVGKDPHAEVLREKLRQVGVKCDGLIYAERKTTTKIRVLGGHQQMIRLDFEDTKSIDSHTQNAIYEYVVNSTKDGVIISDYGKGVCTPNLCQKIISFCNQRRIPVFVDPKGTNWIKYANSDFVTPNINELSDAYKGHVANNDISVIMAAENIKKEYHIKNLLVTRSEKGLSLTCGEKWIHISTEVKDVFDVSGAGDTVISVFAAACSAGLEPEVSAYISNLAAGIGVAKVGTYAVSLKEICTELEKHTIIKAKQK